MYLCNTKYKSIVLAYKSIVLADQITVIGNEKSP